MKKEHILEDYGIAVLSRECSLMGRKEVLSGKAKFGIFGEGKEVPQLALARAFPKWLLPRSNSYDGSRGAYCREFLCRNICTR